VDFSRTTPSDEIEDEPGNPWDESTTPVGSHFGESGDRIRSAQIRGKTSTISREPDQTCHDHSKTDDVIDSGIDNAENREDVNDGDVVDRDEDLIGETNGSNDEEDDGEGW
jgi:hypothetical protein